MSIVKWNPWSLSSFFEDDWDFATVSDMSRITPQGLNIYETEGSVVAEIALPGVPEDKIDVSIDEGVVRVSASNQTQQEEKDKRKYFMSSMAQTYNYSFRLPEGTTADEEPQAILHNGVLTLSFKKVQQIAPKKIKVLTKKDSNSSQNPKGQIGKAGSTQNIAQA